MKYDHRRYERLMKFDAVSLFDEQVRRVLKHDDSPQKHVKGLHTALVSYYDGSIQRLSGSLGLYRDLSLVVGSAGEQNVGANVFDAIARSLWRRMGFGYYTDSGWEF